MGISAQKRLSKIVIYAVNFVLAIVYIAPLIWMVISAFKPESRIFSDMSSINAFVLTERTLDNFRTVFQRSSMLQSMLNSIIYITILVIFSMTVNSICGYALAKLPFRGKGLLLSVIISLLVLPLESVIIPLYLVVGSFGWVNTYLALIVPFIAKCFDIYLFRQFFLDIPDSLIEAASIDGASPFRIFASIVIPLSGPVFATVFILDYVAHWSDFMWPLVAITSSSMRTIQLGLQAFFTDPPVYYGPVLAALSLSAIPMIILFLFFQKYYVQGIATTGIKE